jgi:lipid-binding SYLF domain-containing protein
MTTPNPKNIFAVLLTVAIAGSAFALEPPELDSRIRTLTWKFDELQSRADRRIPADTLRRAQGVILLDRTRAGFVFAYQGGGGVAMVRNKDGEWSPPAFLSANEGSLGFQIGGERDFYAILLMNTNATRMLIEPKFEAGGEARGTAGDTTRGTEGKFTPTNEPVLVFSVRKGLYGGAAVKAGAINPDNEANHIYYSQFVSMKDILFDNKVKATETATNLAKRLDDYTKVADNAPKQPEHSP